MMTNQDIAIQLVVLRLKLGMDVSRNLIDNARLRDCPRDYSATLGKLVAEKGGNLWK